MLHKCAAIVCFSGLCKRLIIPLVRIQNTCLCYMSEFHHQNQYIYLMWSKSKAWSEKIEQISVQTKPETEVASSVL